MFMRWRLRRKLEGLADEAHVVCVSDVVPDLLTRAGTVDLLVERHEDLRRFGAAAAQTSVSICRWLELYAPGRHRIETLPTSGTAAVVFADGEVAARFLLAFAAHAVSPEAFAAHYLGGSAMARS